MYRAVQMPLPIIEKRFQTRIIRYPVHQLPDKDLQEIAVVGQVIRDLRGGKAEAAQSIMHFAHHILPRCFATTALDGAGLGPRWQWKSEVFPMD